MVAILALCYYMFAYIFYIIQISNYPMRILFLTKRQYTNKDLLDDKFGRLREIPLSMARQGHHVKGICLSYIKKHEGTIIDVTNNNVEWESVNAGRLKFVGLVHYIYITIKTVYQFKPDVIIAASDSIYGIIGAYISRLSNIPLVFDLYDNFEYFGAYKIPGIRFLYRWSIKNASGISCVSEPLRLHIEINYPHKGIIKVVENGVRDDLFQYRDKQKCREKLGLPLNAKIIGIAGDLSKSRGVDDLFYAYNNLLETNSNIHLAIAGARDSSLVIPIGKNVHDFGVLPLEEVPYLIGSLDVAVICNKDSLFGRYCFPQKFYEILSCKTPVVCSNIGALSDLLSNFKECLFSHEKKGSLETTIKNQLLRQIVPQTNIPNWNEVANRMDQLIQQVINSN